MLQAVKRLFGRDDAIVVLIGGEEHAIKPGDKLHLMNGSIGILFDHVKETGVLRIQARATARGEL